MRLLIDEEITFREKGYRSTDLKPKSHKEVWAVCEGDDCQMEGGRGRWVKKSDYRNLCRSCAQKQKIEKCKMTCKKRDCIDDDITYAKKGYLSTELNPDSHKEVWRVCSRCGEGRWIEFRYCVEMCNKCAVISENTSQWKGGISFEPYCKKFNNEFKESIRDKFGRKCFMCPDTEEDNGRKLDVHHVNYDKECICNGVECEFVPLCRSCHSKTNGSRELWERLIINVLQYEGWI